MYGLTYIRESVPRPQHKYSGVAAGICPSTSPLRLDLIHWYTSGFSAVTVTFTTKEHRRAYERNLCKKTWKDCPLAQALEKKWLST